MNRYKIFLLLLVVNLLLTLFSAEIGIKSWTLSWQNVKEMISILPAIFILLGLLDVWVKKETMIKLMGEDSGLLGVVLAFLLGSAAAGPLYGAFPVCSVLLKKGSKLTNVLIMLGAWSTTKIPLILFEATSMGLPFMLIRLVLNIMGISVIAWLMDRIMTKTDKEEFVSRACSQV